MKNELKDNRPINYNENKPLIQRLSSSEISLTNYFLKFGEYITCILIGFPVGVLSGLSILSEEDSINLGELNNFSEFANVVVNSSPKILVYASLAFIAGGGVTVFIAKRHLVPACKEVLNLFRKIYNTIYCCHKEKLDAKDKANLGDIFLFIWSIGTALIFGKIGSQALSFFGIFGEISGFVLKFSLASTTRYLSAKILSNHRFDKNWQLKQKCLAKLALSDVRSIRNQIQSVMIYGETETCKEVTINDINKSLVTYLNNPDFHKILRESLPRRITLNGASISLGVILFLITIVPAITCFAPKAVQGLELLLGVEIGENDNYENSATFILGFFFSLLSVIFYELNTFDLPYQLFLTFFLIYEYIKSGDFKEGCVLFTLTAVAALMSYGNAIGVGFVGETLVRQGYLSYMGDFVSSLIPSGLTISAMTMVWSNLQKLINSRKYNASITDYTSFFSVSADNVRGLLNNPETNIESMPQDNFFRK